MQLDSLIGLIYDLAKYLKFCGTVTLSKCIKQICLHGGILLYFIYFFVCESYT